MNGKKISGEISGKNMHNTAEKMTGKNATGENVTGDNMQTQEPSTGATQVERAGSGRKKFPIGWLVPVAAWGFFLGHFWSYIPVVRGIVSLLVFSKFLAGLSGTHFLL